MIDEAVFVAAARQRWYHLVWGATCGHAESVLEHGLERTRSNYVGYWASRPGHTYVGRESWIRRVFFNGRTIDGGKAFVVDRGEADWALFAVDLGSLEAERIVPDEDHFGMYHATGGVEVLRRYRLPFPPCKWAWDWAQYLGIATPASLGEWAEGVNLGADPRSTAHSASCGSLAVRGVIPPSSLRLVHASFDVGEIKINQLRDVRAAGQSGEEGVPPAGFEPASAP